MGSTIPHSCYVPRITSVRSNLVPHPLVPGAQRFSAAAPAPCPNHQSQHRHGLGLAGRLARWPPGKLELQWSVGKGRPEFIARVQGVWIRFADTLALFFVIFT